METLCFLEKNENKNENEKRKRKDRYPLNVNP